MAGEPALAAAAATETTRQQVGAIVAELPFEDDPTTFLPTLVALAEAHALEDEE
jgi:hypothetical protein